MNPDSPQSPREELELRLTALLLGELPDAEATALRETLAHDPELARLHDRLAATLGLIREATPLSAAAEAAKPEPLTLDPQRREVLLKLFKKPAAKIVRPAVPFWTRRRREILQLAAMLVALLTIARLVFRSPSLMAHARAQRVGVTQVDHNDAKLAAEGFLQKEQSEFVARVLTTNGVQDRAQDYIDRDATPRGTVSSMAGASSDKLFTVTVTDGDASPNASTPHFQSLNDSSFASASSFNPNSQPAPESKLPNKIAAELRKAEAPPVPPKPAQVAANRASGVRAENVLSTSAKEKPVALGLDMVTDLAAATDGGGRKPGEAPAKPKEMAQLQDRELPVLALREKTPIALPESTVAVERKRVDNDGVAEPALRAKTAIALPEAAAAEGVTEYRKQVGKEALGKDMVALGDQVHWTESGRLSSGGALGSAGGGMGGGGGARGPQAPASPAPNSGVTTYDLFAAYDSAPSNRGLASAADSPADTKKDAKQLADGTAASSARDLGERGRTMNLTGFAVDALTMPADGVTLAGRGEQNKAQALGDLPVAGRPFKPEAMAGEESRKAGGAPAAGQANSFGVNGLAPYEKPEPNYFISSGGDVEAKQKAPMAGSADGEKFYFDANRNAQVEFGREAKWVGVLENPTPGGGPNQGVPASGEAKGERAGRALAGLEMAKAKAEPAPVVAFDADAPVKTPVFLRTNQMVDPGNLPGGGGDPQEIAALNSKGVFVRTNSNLIVNNSWGFNGGTEFTPPKLEASTFKNDTAVTGVAAGQPNGRLKVDLLNASLPPPDKKERAVVAGVPIALPAFAEDALAKLNLPVDSKSPGSFPPDIVAGATMQISQRAPNWNAVADGQSQPESAMRTEELAKGLKEENALSATPSRTLRLPPAPAGTQPSFAGSTSTLAPEDSAKFPSVPKSDPNGREVEHETLRRELTRGTTVAKAQKQLADNLGELSKDRPDSTAQRLSETDKKLEVVEDIPGIGLAFAPTDKLARLSREKQAAAPEGKPAASTGTLVQDGKQLFEMRLLDEAESKLKEALIQDPDSKSAYYYLTLVEEARYGDEARKRDFAQKTRLMEVDKASAASQANLYVNSAGNDGRGDANSTIGDAATMKNGVAVGQLEGPRRITNTVVRADGNGGWTTNVETVWGYEFGKSQKDRAGAATGVEKAPAKIEKSKTPPPPPATPPPTAPIPQPEISATANAFSTFSLNVSDVSFKLAAASLEKGVMPDVTTLRAEEFLNALDYHDPEPTGGARLAFAWERARDPFAHDRDYLRFSVKTAASGRQAGRPLNLVLLLDNSGSMERADRVLIRQECLRVLAGQLQAGDRVSVIAFARTARLFIDGLAGERAAELPNRVGELTPEGGTNLEDAMNLAWRTAARHYLPNGMNRVVLLTDGAANLGEVDPASLKKQVEAQRKQGMALDCFGIGWDGYNDDLLEALSRNGDGRYGFINTPEAAAHDFAGQLAGALKIAASDVKVQVEWNPRRVTVWRQIGYAKHQLKKEEFRDNKVDAAEIAAQEAGNALYTVQVNPAGEGPLGVVRVRYKIPGTTDYREHEWPVPYEGAARPLEQGSDAMRLAATSSAFSEWLASSPFAGEVTPDGLLGYLNGVPERYAADPRPKQLEAMIRQARSLVGK